MEQTTPYEGSRKRATFPDETVGGKPKPCSLTLSPTSMLPWSSLWSLAFIKHCLYLSDKHYSSKFVTCLTFFSPDNRPIWLELWWFLFYIWGNWGARRLSDSVTELQSTSRRHTPDTCLSSLPSSVDSLQGVQSKLAFRRLMAYLMYQILLYMAISCF